MNITEVALASLGFSVTILMLTFTVGLALEFFGVISFKKEGKDDN